jgi:hypothetical protein
VGRLRDRRTDGTSAADRRLQAALCQRGVARRPRLPAPRPDTFGDRGPRHPPGASELQPRYHRELQPPRRSLTPTGNEPSKPIRTFRCDVQVSSSSGEAYGDMEFRGQEFPGQSTNPRNPQESCRQAKCYDSPCSTSVGQKPQGSGWHTWYLASLRCFLSGGCCGCTFFSALPYLAHHLWIGVTADSCRSTIEIPFPLSDNGDRTTLHPSS